MMMMMMMMSEHQCTSRGSSWLLLSADRKSRQIKAANTYIVIVIYRHIDMITILVPIKDNEFF